MRLSGQKRKWALLLVLAAMGLFTAKQFVCPADHVRPYMIVFALWIAAKTNLEVILQLPIELPYFYEGRELTNLRARRIALIVSWGVAAYAVYLATTFSKTCVR